MVRSSDLDVKERMRADGYADQQIAQLYELMQAIRKTTDDEDPGTGSPSSAP